MKIGLKNKDNNNTQTKTKTKRFYLARSRSSDEFDDRCYVMPRRCR